MGTATEAHGAAVKVSNMAASSPTFTAIALIESGPSGPSLSPNMIEAYTHDQNLPHKKPTYVTTSPVTFTILYDSADTQHAQLRDAAKAKTRLDFQMVLDDTGDEQLAFSGYVGFEWMAEPGDFNKVNITIEIDGDITIT
jgi:hypothetical protein